MCRSNWLFIVALGGCLSSQLASCAYAQAVRDNASTKPSAAKDDKRPHQNLEPALSGIQHAINSVADAVEAAKASPDTQADKQRAEKDLKAQQGMEKWARWMFFATLGGTILTGVGLILIGRTLIYTKGTLNEAKAATVAAQETGKIAESTLRETSLANQRQLRAYVGTTDVVVEGAGNKFDVCVDIKI